MRDIGHPERQITMFAKSRDWTEFHDSKQKSNRWSKMVIFCFNDSSEISLVIKSRVFLGVDCRWIIQTLTSWLCSFWLLIRYWNFNQQILNHSRFCKKSCLKYSFIPSVVGISREIDFSLDKSAKSFGFRSGSVLNVASSFRG